MPELKSRAILTPMKFTVPQFIDVEDKVLFAMTIRQFGIILITVLIDAVLYKVVYDIYGSLLFFLPSALVVTALGGTFAFFRVNGQPFHFFLLNVIQTYRRPKIRAWNKTLTDVELRSLLKAPPAPKVIEKPRKEAFTTARLSELSLIVNTGGMYRPEE